MKDEPTNARITDTKDCVGDNPHPTGDTAPKAALATHAAHHRDTKKSNKNNKALWVAIFAVIVVILLVCLFFCVLKAPADVDNNAGKDIEDVASVTDAPTNVVVAGEDSDDAVTPESNQPSDDVRVEVTEIVVDNDEKTTMSATYRNDNHATVIGTEDEPSTVGNNAYDEPIPMAMVEQKPEFPGGLRALYEWLAKNFEYPAGLEKFEGTVMSEFVVERDGSVTNIRITKHSSYTEFDEEVLRVLNRMPNWTAGRHLGENVRVIYILPVSFKIK